MLLYLQMISSGIMQSQLSAESKSKPKSSDTEKVQVELIFIIFPSFADHSDLVIQI